MAKRITPHEDAEDLLGKIVSVAELKRLRKYAQFHDSIDALKLIDQILKRAA